MRGTDRLERLVDTAPLPLAQGVARVLNAKTDIELHSKALDLVELSVALAAAIRIAFALESFAQLPARLVKLLDKQLEGLTSGMGLSLGKFSQLLAAVAACLDQSEHAELLGSAVLSKTHGSWLGLTEYGEELLRESSLPRDAVLSTRKRGILGFYELCTAYRNREKGHGATRYDAYYERMGPALCGALADVLSAEALLGPGELVAIERFGSGLRQRRLRGCIGRALRGPTATRMWEGSVVWKHGEQLLALAPFVTHWLTEAGADRVGVISRLEAGGKRARYVDYPSGDQTSLAAGATAFRVLHRRIHADGQLAPEEVAEVVQQAAEAAAIEEASDPGASSTGTEAVFDLGDYDLVDELGRGGMGVVYLARDRRLDRKVALKVSAAPGILDELNSRRLRRETVALARADHPNVIKVFSSGRAGSEYYFAMEHIDGVDLAKLSTQLRALREDTPGRSLDWREIVASLRLTHDATTPAGPAATGPAATDADDGDDGDPTVPGSRTEPEPDPAPSSRTEPEPEPEPKKSGPRRSFYHELAHRFAGVARGVAHLHAHGVIHRDIKPSNLMMTADGERFVVTDLGLAKLDDASVDLTKSGDGPVGTLRYSAPEQLQPDLLDVDERTDVYGLGATLYELATGRSCHDELEDKQLIRQILLGAPLAPRKVDPDLPKELAIVIEKAIAKEPERRYAGAEALADDLDRVASDVPPLARPVGPLRRMQLWTRRHPSATVLAATVAVLLGLVGFAAPRLSSWLAPPTGVEAVGYYANIVERWGVREGHRPLTPWERGSAHVHYAVFTVDGRTVAVERRHAGGSPFPDATGVVRWEYEYTAQGRVHKATSATVNGKIVQVDNFDCWDDHHCRVRALDEQSNLIKAAQLTSEIDETAIDSNDVFAAEKVYDEQGRLATISFLGPGALEPRPHPGGYWGSRFDYVGGEPLPSRETHLGPDGEPAPSIQGVGSIEVQYDGFGHPTRRAYFDQDHAPVPGHAGCAVLGFEYAAPGAMTASRCLDGGGNPALTDDGWSRSEAEYDAHGNQIQVAYFGTDDAPVLERTIDVHRIATRYDDAEQIVSESYFGVDGESVRAQNRAHRLDYVRDELGNPLRIAAFDGAGEPDVSSSTGVHEWRYTRDARGNVTRYDYFDADGQRTHQAEGWAAQVVEFDPLGHHETAVFHFDVDGRPTSTQLGYHAEHNTYDKRGNLIAWSYTDIHGRPAIDPDRVHAAAVEVDEFGREASHTYFGGDGEPVLTDDGYHRIAYAYNPIGQLEAVAHYGAEGQPVHTSKAFCAHYQFDQLGRVTVVTYEGIDGKPGLSKIGAHEIHVEYDRRGWISGRRHYGVAGEPIMLFGSFHRIAVERDQFGQVSATSYFGLDDERVSKQRCWRETFEYDERGLEIAKRCFGVDGQPTASSDGWHLERSNHDDHGRVIDQSFFAVDGEPVLVGGRARVTTSYDARGRITGLHYFGVDGEPIAGPDGAHREHRTLDRYGRTIKLEKFGIDGKPVQNEGCDVKAFSWDTRGQRIDLLCLDREGRRMVSAFGWSRVHSKRDLRGDYVEKYFYDVDDHPIADPQAGYHRRVSVFDLGGRIVNEQTFDAYDELIVEQRNAYDGLGHLVRAAWFDADEAPTTDERGCHAVEYGRDHHGRMTRETCLDADGRPILDARGIATTRRVYDPYGNELVFAHHGVDDEPIVPSSAGFHARQRTFDARGHLDSVEYVDARQQPIAVSGYHQQRLEHDALGRRVSESYFGPRGEPAIVAGFHRRVSRYGEHGDASESRHYDAAGRPTSVTGTFLLGAPKDASGQVVPVEGSFLVVGEWDEAGRQIRESYFGPGEQPTTVRRGDVDCHTIVITYDRKTGRSTTTYLDVDGDAIE